MEHLNVKWEGLRLLLSPEQPHKDGESLDTVGEYASKCKNNIRICKVSLIKVHLMFLYYYIFYVSTQNKHEEENRHDLVKNGQKGVTRGLKHNSTKSHAISILFRTQ